MSQKKNKDNKKGIRKFIFKSVISAGIILLILVFTLFMLVRMGVFGEIPAYADLKKIKNNVATNIYSVDNKLLGRYYYQNRTNVSIEAVPEELINALVATEDVRFFKHKGIDIRSTVRVFVKTMLFFKRNSGGGSTITQQLAKNLFGRKSYGILTIPVAKFREIIIAHRIENLYTKKEILELYLNTVSFGENTYGIETASIIFFNKEPDKLNIEESALLVGLLKANTSYNPRTNTKAALKRRNVVLSQMCKYGYLETEEKDSLQKLPVKLKYKRINYVEGLAPYFREYVRKECAGILNGKKQQDGTEYNLYTDGLKVYTTINARMQEYLENSVNKNMSALQMLFDKDWKNKEPWVKNPELAMLQIEQSPVYKTLLKKGFSKQDAIKEMKVPHKTQIFTWEGVKDTIISPLDSLLHHFKMLQTGALVMNASSGDILAWVGGINYQFFQYDHVTSKRQSGSTIKPIVYASALNHGIKPCDFYENDSVVYEQYDNWTPQNSGEPYGGFYSVKGALANSVNTISVKLLMESGIDTCINLAQRMGITSELPRVPSMALGTGEVSLYEMVKAYAVFLNHGKSVEPRLIRRIEDAEGNILYVDGIHTATDSVISEETAQTVLAMMEGVVNRGTAHGLRTIWNLESDFAGKTGTTQNGTDAWFIGMNPKLVTGVWVGGENPVVRFRNSVYGQGAYAALPVFADFYSSLYRDKTYGYLQNDSFEIPDSVYSRLDCNDFEEEHEPRIFEILTREEDESIGDFIRRIFKRNRKKRD